MNTNENENIFDILQALEMSKANVYQDQDELAQDEYVMEQVMEFEFDLRPLGEHLGISLEQFPSAESLEDDEIKILVEKILDTWATYNYCADFPPKGVPIRTAYKKVLSVWNNVVSRIPEGRLHFDFYEFEPENYPYPF